MHDLIIRTKISFLKLKLVESIINQSSPPVNPRELKNLCLYITTKPMNLANKQADSLVFLCFMKSIIIPRNNN